MAGVLRIVREPERAEGIAGYEHGNARCHLSFCGFVLAASAGESGLFIHFVKPAAAGCENMIEPCGIRFDVEHGRTVEYINAPNGQHIAVYAQQFDDTQTDGVGTQGRTCGEYAMFDILQKRFDHQFWRTGTMQMVYEIKMGKAFDIFEAGGIGWKYFQYSLTVLCEYGLCRCLLCNGVFAVDDTDRRIGNGLRYRTGLTFFSVMVLCSG